MRVETVSSKDSPYGESWQSAGLKMDKQEAGKQDGSQAGSQLLRSNHELKAESAKRRWTT